jgi:hypothetical protein
MQTKESLTVEGLSLVLSAKLTANFEKADSQLLEFYGESPGVPELVRFWLACSTASLIRKEFELAVFDIKTSNPTPNAEGHFDEDSL